MPETTDDETGGPTDQELAELIRAERHRAQIEERRRRNGLKRQAEETASLLDVIGALAAHGALVSVHTKAGTQPPATILDVGRDYVALRGAGLAVRLIPVGQVAAARAIGAGPAPMGPTRPAGGGCGHELHLSERLRELAARRSAVRLTAAAGTVTGRLRGVGLDVLVVEQDDGTEAFVALGALAEVVVEP
ncbi:hypothetical protein ACE2AJ_20315 [Aquihabitans daechungensis]|uniref:hypothetical protein n=1 Tax=Aquihabitans daechungensis TaxID=1052257 RepID=UPI003BA12B55